MQVPLILCIQNFFHLVQMNQIRAQLDNESRNLAAATDDNIHLKAQVESLHSKNINLEAKVSIVNITNTLYLELSSLALINNWLKFSQ